jgi:putative transposase
MDEAQKIENAIKDLDKWIKTNPDSRELKRAIAVKLSLQGWTYKAIADILNVSKSFIGKWKTQFEDRGIEGLRLSYQGAKSYLTKAQKQEVINWLQQQEHWTLPELESYLNNQFDVSFKSQTSYYNLLKEAKVIANLNQM